MSLHPTYALLPIRAFQWDLARQVERLDFLLGLLPRYAEWGYEELYVHLEDAVEYPSLPGVARPDAYSYKQFARLVEAATAAGIRVVPIVNLLGHTQYLIKTPALRDLNELRDAAGGPLAQGQICPLHPHMLETADKLLRDMAPFCTAGKMHVGLDESFHLGKCPRCMADVERRGLAAHFAGYVKQLERLTAGRGLRLGMWADMLALLPEAIPLLPRNVIAYDWYYYPFARHPRVELRNFAEVDLATPLQKRGIEYWGCPMNGSFRYEPMPVFGDRLANILSWWKRCRRVGAGGFLVTSWEANRLAIELTTTVDAAAACLWLNPEIEEPREMLARGFERVFGGRRTQIRSREHQTIDKPGALSLPAVSFPNPSKRRVVQESAVGSLALAATSEPKLLREQSRMRLDATAGWRRLARAALACDDFAFAGYHRWQINDRWDVCTTRGGSAPYAKELRALERIYRSLLAGDGVEWHGRPARGLNIAAGPPVPQDRLPLDKLGALSLQAVSLSNPSNGQAGSYNIPPPALAASLAFRLYLAQRDVFVRRAAEGVFRLRQEISRCSVLAHQTDHAGRAGPLGPPPERTARPARRSLGEGGRSVLTRQAIVRSSLRRLQHEASSFASAISVGLAAARTMWRRSRDPHVRGPNQLMLDRDTKRLREWAQWLRRAARNPEMILDSAVEASVPRGRERERVDFASTAESRMIWQATPVCGAWQLLFTVHNFAPALQKVVVEQQKPDGTWETIHGLHTIEFRAEAAKPRTRIRREFSVPLTVAAGNFHLRLAVRGVGQVAISHVEITNGVDRYSPKDWPLAQKRRLGRLAPRRKFPVLDWTRNRGELTLQFDPTRSRQA